MSLQKNNFIEPQDFINLRNQVKAEIKRRNYANLNQLYNLYAIDSYDFPTTPVKEKPVLYSDLETILKPLNAINTNTVNISHPSEDVPITVLDFNQIQNALNIFSKGQRRSNNTCASSCIGMCVGCTDNCTSCSGCSGCSGCSSCSGCSGSCSGTCTGNCSGCSGGCTGSSCGGSSQDRWN